MQPWPSQNDVLREGCVNYGELCCNLPGACLHLQSGCSQWPCRRSIEPDHWAIGLLHIVWVKAKLLVTSDVHDITRAALVNQDALYLAFPNLEGYYQGIIMRMLHHLKVGFRKGHY